MKIHSLRALMSAVSVGAVTLSVSAFAHHDKHLNSHHKHSTSHHHSHKERLCPGKLVVDNLTADANIGFHTFFEAGQIVLSCWGTTEDPDPTTNTFLASIIAANTQVADDAVGVIIESLSALRVKEGDLATINAQFDAYFAAFLAYTDCFNHENVLSGPQPMEIFISCQDATYQAFIASAAALGQSLADISEYPAFVTSLQNQAFLQANAIQAARGLLVSPPANPSDPASEGAALTALIIQIQIAAGEICDVLIKRVAHEQCEKILKL